MGSVRRVFVEKKPDYAIAAKELRHEIRRYLGIMDVTGVRVSGMTWRISLMIHLRKHAAECSQSRR